MWHWSAIHYILGKRGGIGETWLIEPESVNDGIKAIEWNLIQREVVWFDPTIWLLDKKPIKMKAYVDTKTHNECSLHTHDNQKTKTTKCPSTDRKQFIWNLQNKGIYRNNRLAIV